VLYMIKALKRKIKVRRIQRKTFKEKKSFRERIKYRRILDNEIKEMNFNDNKIYYWKTYLKNSLKRVDDYSTIMNKYIDKSNSGEDRPILNISKEDYKWMKINSIELQKEVLSLLSKSKIKKRLRGEYEFFTNQMINNIIALFPEFIQHGFPLIFTKFERSVKSFLRSLGKVLMYYKDECEKILYDEINLVAFVHAMDRKEELKIKKRYIFNRFSSKEIITIIIAALSMIATYLSVF